VREVISPGLAVERPTESGCERLKTFVLTCIILEKFLQTFLDSVAVTLFVPLLQALHLLLFDPSDFLQPPLPLVLILLISGRVLWRGVRVASHSTGAVFSRVTRSVSSAGAFGIQIDTS
jgi:hypothetical protein